MNGSSFEKIQRLLGHLISHPKDIIRYLKHSRSSPLECEIPWFSWSAIDYLSANIKPEATVFEYGSGGSTVYFSNLASSITSVEDNKKWLGIVGDAISVKHIDNANLIYADLKNFDGTFLGSDYVKSLDRPYSVIVIDGSENWPDEILRPVCFYHAESFVEVGGMIIVDDAWRYDGMINDHKAWQKLEFQGVGPARYGVTRTDVYLY